MWQRKVKKFFNHPGIFIRDYLNKKYPSSFNEQKFNESDEFVLIHNQHKLLELENRLQSPLLQEVDVVFTWVNDKDPKWCEKFNYFSERYKQPSGLYSKDRARFTNHNELYYSLHSVRTFLPWVRKIFIVTDGQKPDWLEISNNIIIIDHSVIIDKQYLPTFNSHVIEAHLHKIPDLSENFIYFNDDVFVARPLLREHFFRANGIASLFLSSKSLDAMLGRGVITPTLQASLNVRSLLRITYGIEIDIPLVHTYVPLKKSMFKRAWELYNNEIENFLRNKFRGGQDLNLATFLVPWLMFLEKQSVSSQEICYYFNIRSPNALTHYQKLLKHNQNGTQPHSFCANDFNSQKSIPDYHRKLEDMLKVYYSIR